jgi:predicted transcriptional regulator
MDGATRKISEHIRHKGFNLSEISRKTNLPYMALYDSIMNEKRDRDLRVDEFLALCRHLGVNPMDFYPAETAEAAEETDS